ncbi:class II aldolase/adducin family protein [Arthrobacter sp. Sa2CUA1]|uniref:Class II aldolase/adducin family protein n=1 Tax=Arthrobacter gallicola TaxID=2762225 RepID=A0ABR8UT29_9MICC|nr:class II aldolase/adducin family protein [Arthrobacter gallicola]MBD7995725.1 class II aldolase/adducin family protein [Arthrobacter gallicola]
MTAAQPGTRLIGELVDAGKAVVAAGLSPGSSGNISVRGDDGRIYITPGGSSLGALDPDRISVLSPEGDWLSGDKPSKEIGLHLGLYRKNPDHYAVVHVHSAQAVAASCVSPWSEASALPPLTPYFVMRAGQTPLVPYRAPGSADLGKLLLAIDYPFSSALLQNHGQVTSARTLAGAIDAAVEVEEASRIALLTAGQERRLLTDAEITELTGRYGSDWTLGNR